MKKISLFFPFLLTACSADIVSSPASFEVPGHWQKKELSAATDLQSWWQDLQTPELSALETKAVENNLDLRVARARVQEARSLLVSARSNLFPTLDYSAEVDGVKREAKADLASSGQAALNIRYELDLFGGHRASRESAAQTVKATLFDQQAVALVVSTETAKTYALCLSLKDRLRIADEDLKDVTQILKLLKARYAAGAVSAFDVQRQTTVWAQAEAGRVALREALEKAQNALAVLVGEAPQNFSVAGESLEILKIAPLTPALPATLLIRRPDILSAEADLKAAHADIQVARAALFPQLNIGAALQAAASPLMGSTDTAATLLASLIGPVFHGGALTAEVERAKAVRIERLENYRQAILTALREGADALAARHSAALRADYQAQAMDSATSAYRLARQKFDAGSISYLDLLDAERSLLTAKDNRILAQLDHILAALDLYKALGGGWSG